MQRKTQRTRKGKLIKRVHIPKTRNDLIDEIKDQGYTYSNL